MENIINGETRESSLKKRLFWINQIDKVQNVTTITSEFYNDLLKSEYKVFETVLPENFTEKLYHVTRNKDKLMYLFLVTGVAITLSKYLNQKVIVIESSGMRNGNDNSKNDLLPLIFEVDVHASFRQLLSSYIGMMNETYESQDFDLKQVKDMFQEGKGSDLLLSDIGVIFEGLHIADNNGLNKLPILIHFIRRENEIQCKIRYNSSLYTCETVDNIWNYIKNLVEFFINNPDALLDQHTLLTEDMKLKILNDFAGKKADYPIDDTISQLFELQVEKTPNKIAVKYYDKSITYKNLNERANQVAIHLRNLGVASNHFVGIYMQRNIKFVISILGIMKAGAAYVPIDPEYPQERVTYMLKNSHMTAVISSGELVSKIADDNDLFILILDELIKDTIKSYKNIIQISQSDNNIHNVKETTNGSNYAYMIYTSGTTGRPKGAIIRHSGAINHIYAQFDDLHLKPGFNFLQSASACSDISVWQFLAPILFGGSTIIMDRLDLLDANLLLHQIAETKATIVEFVPVVVQLLIDYTKENGRIELPDLQYMMITGETVSKKIINDWLNIYPDIKVVNCYGPTEASDDITQKIFEHPLEDKIKTITIGKALNNINIYIINSDRSLAPIGVAGEICVSGIAVGAGYLNDDEKTKEKFYPDEFIVEPGRMIYRTGDTGKWMLNGDIEFIGRVDNQVEIKGHRIELDEIESVISLNKLVAGVAVTLENANHQQKLYAYYETVNHSVISPDEIKLFIGNYLPTYMIPNVFIQVERLPRTPVGKIDRKQLHVANIVETNIEDRRKERPENEIQKKLYEIWSDILEKDDFGINDSFFVLGGDSIASIQMVSRADQYGIKFTPKDVFEYDTIKKLSEHCKVNVEDSVNTEIIQEFYPLSPIQKWFFGLELKDRNHFNQSIFLNTYLTEDQLNQIYDALMEQHKILSSSFCYRDNEIKQIINGADRKSNATTIDLTMVHPESRTKVIEEITDQIQRSLDLFQSPIFRMVYMKIDHNQSGRLLLVVHHSIVDSVSWRVLLSDLQKIYAQLIQGKRISLPKKTTSFNTWVIKLEEYAKSEQCLAEKDYWLHINRDYKDNYMDSFAENSKKDYYTLTSNVGFELSETQTTMLQETSILKVSSNDIILSGLVLAYQQWSNNSFLHMDMEGHGRDAVLQDINISHTVGWFSIIYPVVFEITKDADIMATINMVKSVLSHIPNRGVGYGLLTRNSNKEISNEFQKAAHLSRIRYNYLGKLDQIIHPETGWTLAEESKGEPVDIKTWYNRQYLIDINCYILNGKLNMTASYDDQVISKDKMQNLLDYYKFSLIEIIDKVNKSKGKDINVTDSYKDTLLEDYQIERILHKYDDVEDIYPVSNMQESILAHNIFSSNNGNDVQNLVFNIEGNINLEFFVKAIEGTMNNNSLLRTSFEWRRISYPHQIVHKHVDLDIEVLDLQDYPQSEKDEEIKKIIDTEKHTSFQTDKAPLMRFRIVRYDENRVVFIWSSFTSLVDNWSYNIIAKEIFSNYKMLLEQKKTLAQAKHPFKNYIQWIQKQDKNEAKKFWMNQLINCESVIAKEAANPFGQDLNDKFELVESYRSISSEDNKKLKEYVARNNCTIFNLLECLWGIVIAKHYNTKKAVLGVLTTGRIPDIKGIETMVGMFVNILPVSIEIDGNLTLTEMMRTIQINQIDILKNSYLPIDEIAECNNLNVKELNSIIHDKTIVFVSDVNENWDKDMIDDVKIEYEMNTIAINVPFRLYVVPGEELTLDIKYNKYACDSEVVDSLLDQLQYLLKCVIINSSTKIDELYDK